METKIIVKTEDEQEKHKEESILRDLMTVTCEEINYAKFRV